MRKYCPKCRQYLLTEEFRKTKRGKNSLSILCMKCQAEQVYIIRPDARQNRQMRRRFMKMRRIKAYTEKYGLSEVEWTEMLAKQSNLCAICGGKDAGKVLCVDHDHTTGKVRGMLCGNCNIGLGNFKDSPKILESAIAYLLGKVDGSK